MGRVGVIAGAMLALFGLAATKRYAADAGAEAAIMELKAETAAIIAAQPPLSDDLGRPPVIWRTPGAIQGFRDSGDAPEMVVIPAGEYTIGSPATEAGRRSDEGPRHRVRIGYAFAVSKFPITVAEYARFIAESRRDMKEQCQGFTADGKWDYALCDWSRPGIPQGDDNPVVAVSWEDAQAFAVWLSGKTGRRYRLMSEAEYEYANRAGTTTAYAWGDDPAASCSFANGADLDARAQARFSDWKVNGCHDGHPHTAPVAAFRPNAFGLYAMSGNTWSWTQDCWSDSYANAPVDGSPKLVARCRTPVVRGGSWADTPENLRTASRGRNLYYIRFAVNGFRMARDL